MKICSICKINKEDSCFGPDKRSSTGLRCDCKLCRKKHYYNNHEKMLLQNKKNYKKYREDRIKRSKQYYINNKQKKKEYDKIYLIKNKQKIRTRGIIYWNKNKKLLSIKKKKYYEQNKEKFAQKAKIYRQKQSTKDKNKIYISNKLKSNPQFKMLKTLRNRLGEVLKKIKTKKSTSTLNLLGCDLLYFVKHIENQFTPKMNWNNHGKVWHLDHEKPCCSFDLTQPEEQAKCFHYSNIRPLLTKDNLLKSHIDKQLSIN
jgi:Prasinovirus endonuclease VII